MKKILIPKDDSDLARHTTQRAVTYAKECGAQSSVFFVMLECASDDDGDSELIQPMLPDDYASTVKKRARRHLGEIERKCAEAGVACSAIDAVIELACTSDEPHEAMIREASGSTAPESSHWWPD